MFNIVDNIILGGTKMKKFLAILVVCAMALTLVAACAGSGGGGGSSGGGGSDGEVKGDLLIWLDNEDWAAALIAAFVEKYPNVNVRHEQIAHTESRAKVELDGPAGEGPDIFHFPHDHAANAINDGLVEPIPADLASKFEASILTPAINTVKSDGRLYAAPFSTENIALFYNKDLVDFVPKTFEEIIEFAKSYNDPAADKFAMRWQINDAYHNYPFLTAFGFSVFGANMDDYRNPGFDLPGVANGLRFHSSLRETVYPLSTDDGADWGDSVGAFQRGETPFTISGPWAIGDARDNGINFGVTKLPTINGTQPRCFSGARVMAVSSFSNNFPAAFAFLEFVASVEGAAILYEVTGMLPALKDSSGVPGLSENEWLMGILEQSPFADPMPVIPEVHAMWEPLADLFTFTWDGHMSPEDAQAKAMETYEILLNAQGKSIHD